MVAEAMLFIAAILRLGESPQMAHPIDADSIDRMVTCLQVRTHAASCFCQEICVWGCVMWRAVPMLCLRIKRH